MSKTSNSLTNSDVKSGHEQLQLFSVPSKGLAKVSKKIYQSSFILLVKSFCNDEITLDEYKEALHQLLVNYRKDGYSNVIQEKVK
ncbi:hypothetical protein [Dipodfec virus UOA04_Rod_760]|nr:hypothetical protein [Dipodfec virus UOA04_Rod_760]